MSLYGEEFQQYYIDSSHFFEREHKKEVWLAVLLLLQSVIALIGLYCLPLIYLKIWMGAIIASLAITLWALIQIWWTHKKYSSFNNWKKYVQKP